MHCAGGQGVGYFDKDPLVNNGNAALRKNEGVEVSEDNVSVLSTACNAALMHTAHAAIKRYMLARTCARRLQRSIQRCAILLCS
jgi:hypothetical protein